MMKVQKSPSVGTLNEFLRELLRIRTAMIGGLLISEPTSSVRLGVCVLESSPDRTLSIVAG
jgi:hypothetical protein